MLYHMNIILWHISYLDICFWVLKFPVFLLFNYLTLYNIYNPVTSFSASF